MLIRGILPIIPPRSHRKMPKRPDSRRFRDLNRVERMSGRPEQQRRIEILLSFKSFLDLAAPV